jgi:hypothetical protein
MTNRFGLDLYPKEVRWAAAEGVSEDVIAAVLLLHERSVEEIVPQLSPLEPEKVIELAGRSPRLYPRRQSKDGNGNRDWSNGLQSNYMATMSCLRKLPKL